MGFFESLAHYFYPRYSNNHKAKLLHSSSLIFVTVLLIGYQFALAIFPATGLKVLGYAANISTDEVIRLTNVKRADAGLGALRYNAQLAQAARAKAAHMLQYDYWSHVAPDGTEPWKFFTDANYRYRYAGENLARDFTNPTSVVDAWMASTSHRDNLMSTKYADIGVAVAEGDLSGVDTTIVVQLFGTPLSDTTTQVTTIAAKPVTPTPKPVVVATEVLTETPESSPAGILETPSVTPIPVVVEVGNITDLPAIEKKASRWDMLISPFQTTRGISIAITALLLLVLVVDIIVVARKRIARVGGRAFAHFAFLGMVLAILFIAKVGKIL